MQFAAFFALLAAPAMVVATLDKATSNTPGKYPTSPACSASKTSTSIQAAECAYNTRTSDQTFAVFETDHQYDDVYGAPYGTCSAYSCTAPTDDDMESDSDYWSFFWRYVSTLLTTLVVQGRQSVLIFCMDSDDGESSGVGTTCIKDPSSGECGCENSDGTFVAGSSSCT